MSDPVSHPPHSPQTLAIDIGGTGLEGLGPR